jgi:hypothetical protein
MNILSNFSDYFILRYFSRFLEQRIRFLLPRCAWFVPEYAAGKIYFDKKIRRNTAFLFLWSELTGFETGGALGPEPRRNAPLLLRMPQSRQTRAFFRRFLLSP